MVVSHVEKDHIIGIRTLLEREEVEFEVGDFWHNGFHHLPTPNETEDDESLGAKQREALSAALIDQAIHWNQHFDGQAVVVPDHGALPAFTYPGGMKITLLGPTSEALTE